MQNGEGAPSERAASAQALGEPQQHARMPSAVRTHQPAAAPNAAGGNATLAGGLAAGDANGFSADADGDGWMSGPFRSAPMAYVMHTNSSGTPLASPRTGPATPEREPWGQTDLEAPLLAWPKHRGHRHRQQFDSGGLVKVVVFGLINTTAGVVGGAWRVQCLLRQEMCGADKRCATDTIRNSRHCHWLSPAAHRPDILLCLLCLSDSLMPHC